MMSTITDDPTEIDLLLEELYQRHHCDFRGYSRPSLLRSIHRARHALEVSSVAALRELIARDAKARRTLLHSLTTQVSDLFRDPEHFLALRERVVPHLATYPSIRVWIAGCGTGEEAQTLAIILHEAGLLERSLIYATDIDEESLRKAAAGSFAADRLAGFTENYRKAGGRAALSDYYRIDGPTVTFDPALREHMLFSEHSLATDSAFAEVQLVSCRNVLIYFAPTLRDRTLSLFLDALCPRGFLGLGTQETLGQSEHADRFAPFAAAERIYRRA